MDCHEIPVFFVCLKNSRLSEENQGYKVKMDVSKK